MDEHHVAEFVIYADSAWQAIRAASLAARQRRRDGRREGVVTLRIQERPGRPVKRKRIRWRLRTVKDVGR